MPELPDVVIYVERLRALLIGQPLEKVRLKSIFLVRSVSPPVTDAVGREVTAVERIGKRIAIGFDDLWFVLHLMIAGRLRWRKKGSGLPGRAGLAAFDFPHGSLIWTEASKQKRAALYVTDDPHAFDPGGLEVFDCTVEQFAERLRSENHTLKRSLTSPRLFSGIGNAYSDEILHHARLSPLTWTSRLNDEEIARLLESTRAVLQLWTDRFRDEVGDGFPDKVTAFRPEMAVHGKFREACPDCGSPVQRIVKGENETNYCPTCQTGGKIYADRALSKLLGKDWPRTVEEWEELRER
ncbi:MAG: DNA-formamidopyrimidine glycosylase family protein [Planctomycetota bacterium]|jgi:formamidopyrimidine-DNA glycosylase